MYGTAKQVYYNRSYGNTTVQSIYKARKQTLILVHDTESF